jgi:hypothetical protein
MKFREVFVNRFTAWGSAAIALLALIGGFIAYDDRLAKAEPTMAAIGEVEEEVELLGKDLNYQKLIWRRNAIQQRIWDLERHYGGPGLPNCRVGAVLQEYNLLIRELHDIQRKLGGG